MKGFRKWLIRKANELDQYVIYKKVSDDEEEHRTLRKRYKASIEIVINDEVSDFE